MDHILPVSTMDFASKSNDSLLLNIIEEEKKNID
jgi:hypothetical protein